MSRRGRAVFPDKIRLTACIIACVAMFFSHPACSVGGGGLNCGRNKIFVQFVQEEEEEDKVENFCQKNSLLLRAN